MKDKIAIVENLSVDCVIFGFKGNMLKVLLVKHENGISKGQWGLPGGFIEELEDIDKAAYRVLFATTGIKNIYLDQLRIFGKPDRYPFRRVLTMAYFALVRPEKYQIIPGFTASDAQWFNVTELPELIFDHSDMFNCARAYIKNKIRYEPIGLNLLPKEFSLDQLQNLYEVILGKQLVKENFRTTMLNTGMLKTLVAENGEHQGYVFDEKGYKMLLENASIFDFDE